MIQRFKDLWTDQKGQGTTEYILILAVVVMVAMKFKGIYGSKLDKTMQILFRDIDGATQGDSLN